MSSAGRAATDPNGVTGLLSNWLAQLSLSDVPHIVRERAKYLLLDGIGCALVGAKLPWSALAVETFTRFEGRGDKTIIGWGRTTAGPAAALLNGTFIQGFELDDFHPLGPLHSASLILPSLIACAEEYGEVSGYAFLLGAIKGFEVGPPAWAWRCTAHKCCRAAGIRDPSSARMPALSQPARY
jgi:aconitate decarboxylase